MFHAIYKSKPTLITNQSLLHIIEPQRRFLLKRRVRRAGTADIVLDV
jgi:hypothetical protein